MIYRGLTSGDTRSLDPKPQILNPKPQNPKPLKVTKGDTRSLDNGLCGLSVPGHLQSSPCKDLARTRTLESMIIIIYI